VFEKKLRPKMDERRGIFNVLAGKKSQQGKRPEGSGACEDRKPDGHAADAARNAKPGGNLPFPAALGHHFEVEALPGIGWDYREQLPEGQHRIESFAVMMLPRRSALTRPPRLANVVDCGSR
jgi:hypothetical protein